MSKFSHRPQRLAAGTPRPGVILIALLAAFAITVAFCGVWTRSIVSNQQRQTLAEQRVQVRWLADAAVRRAAASLAADPAYSGETWQLAPADITRPQGAAVVIRVEPVAGASGEFSITAQARYPADRAQVRETTTVVFKSPRES